jgi:RimJ/RimL family protein N-acetyltransferase
MPIKTFSGKKIKIRELAKSDLKNVKKFQNYINSLIKEDAKIILNKKETLKEEAEWIKNKIKKARKREDILLIAECDNKIIGTTNIELKEGRLDHIGEFGISILKGYRGIGLGGYLTGEIIKLAKEKLKAKLKIIRLFCFSNNKPAINLYKKFDFKIKARLPKQIQYKGKLVDELIMLLFL